MKYASIVLLTVLWACGGTPEEEGVRIDLKVQELMTCEQSGLRARLELLHLEPCELTVNDDHSVSGTCKVPAGEERQFRLLYYMIHPSEGVVDLASIVTSLDLTKETRKKVTLTFLAEDVFFPDTDGDGRENLVEFCEGTDPTERD